MLVLILVLLLAPFVQQTKGIVFVEPLKGAVKTVERPDCTIDGWMSGQYQLQEDDFLKHNFGFRPLFVRVYNQLDYWLFGKIHTKNIVEGKDGYLFEVDYINEYLGRNFLGKEFLDKKVAKLKSISDSLSARGISLVVVLAAGKASYFPEYFPDNFPPESKTISNYDYFSQAFTSLGILNIDFNRWFISLKDTSTYPLYPKGETHWSSYGAYLVADSIITYIENLKGIKLPHYKLKHFEVSESPRDNDHDIGEAMNLLFPVSIIPMAYPELTIDSTGVDAPVKAMVVADSYYWMLYRIGLSEKIFNNGLFWYYNKNIYSREFGWETIPISEIDTRSEVEKNDIVFILQTEITLDRFAFGFVDKLYELYAQKDFKPDGSLFEKQLIEAHKRNQKALGNRN